MPRPALTDEQRRETRRKIRDAAASLHAENGLANISARAVAERAGVSVGTLYAYFGNLSELMQSLWRTPAARLTQALEGIAVEVEMPNERLRRLLQSYVQFSIDHRSVFRGAFLFVRPESHDAPAQVNLRDDRFFNVFRQAIVDGQQAGLFCAGDADEFTQTVLSGVHGALAMPINMHRLALDASPRTAEQMIELMLDWLSVG